MSLRAVTVGTTTCPIANAPLGFPAQKKSFYAARLHWLFYNNGVNMVYRTSVDGITWSSETVLWAATTGLGISWFFDGVYIHNAHTSASELHYIRGLPNPNGTITWDADQVAETWIAPVVAQIPVITVDSNGCPWIGYNLYTNAADRKPWITKSSTNDGTWVTDAGFPYQLNNVDGALWTVFPTPLTEGRVCAVYGAQSTSIYAALWDGTAWSAEETAATDMDLISHSVGAIGDDVHVVFRHWSATTLEIYYVKRTYGVGWGTPTSMYDYNGPIGGCANLSVGVDGSNLYLIIMDLTGKKLLMQKHNGVSWRSNWLEIVVGEETMASTNNAHPSTYYQKYITSIGITWLTGTISPFTIRFARLGILPPALKTALPSL